MPERRLHLGAFMRPVTIHTGSWRWPGAWADANFSWPKLRRLTQRLEAAKFDAFFMADHLALLDMPWEALRRSHTVTSFDPLTLLPALAAVTERIGLIATASTTYNDAYHVARKFASLDHISGGRAGWNVVTTANPDAAANFGHDTHMAHGERYKRAREFVEVVTGLWDSFADDAFIRDQASGVFWDPSRVHVLDHDGPEVGRVRGPLNVARPVQGWPVLVQAGASEPGRQLAAETAEVVFAAGGPIAGAREFREDLHRRSAAAGRRPPLVLPGCLVVVGDTVEEARAKRARLDGLVHWESAIGSLSSALGVDARAFDPDGPLPEIPETENGKSGRERAVSLARREGLTVRQLAQRIGGYAGLAMVGTPATIADEMEAWLDAGAADGFNIMFPHVPEGLEEFCDHVVPELVRRGLFRAEYEGTTLREHLGLPRPANRFFPEGRARDAAAE